LRLDDWEGRVVAREFFELLEARVDESKIEGIDHFYLFVVHGEGEWLVVVRNRTVRVTEGQGEADVTISVSGDVFARIASRMQSPMTAYMTGKLKINGDTGAALKLQKLF
jgi:putative sterol carrier protein